MKIIFVCTGNTCRSPIAESIAKKLLPQHEIMSRGLFAMDSQPPSVYAAQILAEENFTPPTHAQQLREVDLDADLILTMTADHKQQIQMMYAQPLPVYTLYEYIEQPGEVSDPYGGSYSDYQKIYKELYYLVTELQHRIDFL
ncbi:low molecular weight protein arginine phosphatase [Staphylococcus debuckii]|uniref:low molecular weight protein arginine phosphatase n=1 Tax=Staphylococcus debuckii TaxID=2044912 RepID=UPI000F42EFC2|nr:low molecular weight protein arginine phosphatase [Staphylococcus debuckii]AYU55741.1 low molecular weight protein arginine phosphatase [Staphylococcus debuckii]